LKLCKALVLSALVTKSRARIIPGLAYGASMQPVICGRGPTVYDVMRGHISLR
jgi:hypothetical protein